MNPTEENLLKVILYSPSTGTISVKILYEKVKHRGITFQQVNDFVEKREVHQMFKKPPRIKNYFPITALHKFESLQIDIVDVSDMASANNGVKYLLTCIDVFHVSHL